MVMVSVIAGVLSVLSATATPVGAAHGTVAAARVCHPDPTKDPGCFAQRDQLGAAAAGSAHVAIGGDNAPVAGACHPDPTKDGGCHFRRMQDQSRAQGKVRHFRPRGVTGH